MAKKLENTAFFDFANPKSRGVCRGKNFLQNDFCRDTGLYCHGISK
jgi:hypothetical protein